MGEQIQDVAAFNPLALGLLLILTWLTWTLPRRFAICPLLVMICLMPLGQQLVIAGLHFFLFRVLLLVGLLRIMAKGELRQLVTTRTDRFFIWWVVLSIILGTLTKPSLDMFRNRLGDAYNAIAGYFFVRSVVVEYEDVWVCVRTFAWLSLPVAALMAIEKLTHQNLLYVFGGVQRLIEVREGHLRCQAAFRHPILAGTFGASLIPLLAALWLQKGRNRLLATASILASMLIVVAASSSGALMAFFVAVGSLPMWKWRGHMRLIRRGTVVAVFILALVMHAPIWYVLMRLGDVTGGTGYHRARLIDQAIAHFNEWWLCGTTYTAHWAPYGEVLPDEPNMMDITNHYIMEGVKGGILKLVLFTIIIIQSFKSVGRQLRDHNLDPPTAFLVWALGASLFAHCLSFISITYFDQTILVYYWLLAVISGLDSFSMASADPSGLADDSEPEQTGLNFPSQDAAARPRAESILVSLRNGRALAWMIPGSVRSPACAILGR
jgi:hypothetical protein